MPNIDNTHKTRILVVDDSKLMRKSAVKMLGEQFDVVVAKDGEEGWEKIQEDSDISVVFTDLNMPKLDGYGLVMRIRKSDDPGIQMLPIVVVTGVEDEVAAKERAFESGATDFISKPFNSTEIKARAQAHADYQRDKQVLVAQTDRDILTGTLVRSAYLEQLDKDVSFAARHQENLAVITLEVANFNQLFVKIGKQGADSVVKHVAKLLQQSIRKEDSVGRTGVAKFALSLPTAKKEGVVELAARLASSINNFKAKLKGQPLLISANVSVCCINQGQRPSSEYISKQGELALLSSDKPLSAILLNNESPQPNDLEYISIDRVISQIEKGVHDNIEAKIDSALVELAPLFNMLNENQTQKLIKELQNKAA